MFETHRRVVRACYILCLYEMLCIKWNGIHYEDSIEKDLLLHFNNAKVKDCHRK